ncbi:MAG: choice-of-anchor Q domain-containing protein [Chitinophagales bacterium]
MLLFSLFSCKKDPLSNPNFQLGFSTDTLTFDTVFVTLGSTTKYFTIRNNENKPVLISEIKLEDGATSKYRINVDGVSVTDGSINDITLPAEDSIYVFVEVTVDPNAEALPFLIEDRVLFETNGNQQNVVLQAYGQNAHFFRDSIIETQIWEDDLPYVILNSILIQECHTLTIKEGVDIYFGGGSSMFVAGNLIVEGIKDSMVTFRGVRLDEVADEVEYDDVPGQWNGIYFLRNDGCNITSSFQYAEIRNAQFGMIVGTAALEDFPSATIANGPKLTIENTVIKNNSVFGILSINSTIDAKNVLMFKSGSQLMAIQLGGNYNFEHCTFYNRGSQFLEHQDELLFFSNYFVLSQTQAIESDLEQLNFTNCIIYGTLDDEIFPDTLEGSTAALNYKFDHCLLKSEFDFESNAIDCIYNLNPVFFEPEDPDDAIDDDFRLGIGSPCIDAGNSVTAGSFDINMMVRDGSPDIGAYEFTP